MMVFRDVSSYKLIALFFCLIVVQSIPAQNYGELRFGYAYSLDLIKYTETARTYNKEFNRIHSQTQSMQLGYFRSFNNQKWCFGSGFAYKKTELTINNYFSYYPIMSGGNVVTYLTTTGSYTSKSNSIGLFLDATRKIHQWNNLRGSVGVNTQWYLFEFFNANYASSVKVPSYNIPYYSNPSVYDLPRNFFLSSCNLSAFYRCELQAHEPNLSVALKVSLGTNLYSDWDQFKRYVWVGVGAEIGIRGHKKEQKNN